VTEVDPLAISAAQWAQVQDTLIYLWVFWLSVIGGAVLFITGHAVIPSLAFTGHIGSRARAARPVFYLLALLAALGAAWALASFLNASEVLRIIYPKVWI
jgi:hypothetical protein